MCIKGTKTKAIYFTTRSFHSLERTESTEVMPESPPQPETIPAQAPVALPPLADSDVWLDANWVGYCLENEIWFPGITPINWDHKLMYENCEEESTFVSYWMNLMQIIESISIDRFDKIKERIELLRNYQAKSTVVSPTVRANG